MADGVGGCMCGCGCIEESSVTCVSLTVCCVSKALHLGDTGMRLRG